jgi:hypothetical protein
MKILILALSVAGICGCSPTSRFEKKNDMPWRNYGPDTKAENLQQQNNYQAQRNLEYQRALAQRRQQEKNAAAAQRSAAASVKQ